MNIEFPDKILDKIPDRVKKVVERYFETNPRFLFAFLQIWSHFAATPIQIRIGAPAPAAPK